METTSVDLGMTLADTDLIGNGAAPAELLEIDRAAIFTRPDQTENELTLVNLVVEHEVSSTLTLTGNAYVRLSDIGTYNGDDSDLEACDDDPGFICEEEDGEAELVLDPDDNPIPASDDVEGATVNRTRTEQDGAGFGLQASWSGALGGRENLFVLGVAYDESDIRFDASTELGALDETRLAVPSGFFVGESFTRLNAATSNLGVYLSNTLGLSDRVALTLSGRYNETDVELRDQLGTALDGDHAFDRFNPAIGVTVAVTDALTLYAGYNEANRAPSPVELTCADEDDPCRLPNAFLADPPLEQVVAETLELGARGRWASGGWNAGLFRTTNEDDILFISAGALTNEGYFSNVGRTRRDGIELGLDGQADDLSWFVNYTYLDATFRETLALPSPNNPTAIDGEVLAAPGDRLPLVPSQLLKAGLSLAIGSRLTLGGEMLAGSGFHMRGDEGNDAASIGDYAVLNARAEYTLNENVRLFVNVDNVLDEEYETFGLFGEADEVLGEAFEDSRFFSPAAPRAAWVGVRIVF
jgi:outer membrane receptor protein involved in Fe transport